MGRTNYLGEFEELILTMVLILEDDAYGNTIVKAIKEHQNREVNLSSVHITLYRLEEKGYLESHMGGATKERGGRKKRYFKITNTGKVLLQEMKDARTKLWKLAPQLSFNA
ncbi:MAG: PadR family transcriptional regulator [Bacteroidota bacterium]